MNKQYKTIDSCKLQGEKESCRVKPTVHFEIRVYMCCTNIA